MNYEEIENLNRAIMSNEIELLIKKKISKKENSGLDGFSSKFYSTFQSIEHKSFSNSYKNWKKREHFKTYFTRPLLSLAF